ncbi:oligopeptide/dipeptide ABC transporter ATP-binding protein [Nonomuraea guangzhouensis]|uniref:Oligopeptide/dipeptide ABC transporter ATP-binding protein n=1 Tax=Nonomuraea guangzhouensis TaxID=1291555 RepID=A0ABW4FYP6_9ACTN|nr:ABC transporter ATP-binding protein [Nonomuraea guangzhouensis]
MSELVRAEQLTVAYAVQDGLFRRRIRAVDGVELGLARGEILGLVGESGCGKSTLGRAIVGLTLPSAGRVLLDGVPVPRRRPPGMRRRVQMIYQDPGSSLDPLRTVAQTLAEPLRKHSADQVAHRTRELLEMVGLGEEHLRARPRELSGGQRQRIAIARALAVAPDVLVADEAVASLDASVAGAVLNLLCELRERLNLTVLFISHDLAVVRRLCDRVAVMYLGRVVEEGPAAEVFAHPGHPYTRVLLDAVPSADRRRLGARALGEPPSPLHLPPGCRFHPRCPAAATRCGTAAPPEVRRDGHRVACHFAWQAQEV